MNGGSIAVSALILVVGSAVACGPQNPAGAWLAPAQQPFVFQEALGGEADDVGNALVETGDGGFLLVGYTESFGSGGKDLWLVRTDVNGDTLWMRTYGGEADDYGWDLAAVQDGGFIAVGFTASHGSGGQDIWLLRLDQEGDTLWTRTYGGPGDERGWALASSGDGGHVIAGQARPEDSQNIDLFLLRVDARGDVIWTVDHGGPGIDRTVDVQRTSDGGFAFAGSRSETIAAQRDAYLVRVGSDGKVVWERSFGGGQEDIAEGLELTPDGGFLLVGHTESFGAGGEDLYMVRTDPEGQEVWARQIGEPRDDRATTVASVSDGGYIVAGYTRTEAGDWDIYAVKVDEDGAETWSELFGGAGSDRALRILQARDADFVLVGVVGVVEDGTFDLVLIKFQGGED